nr:MAG TPA: Interferon-related developmental regulator (IFRD) [Herelleviridae sp.]
MYIYTLSDNSLNFQLFTSREFLPGKVDRKSQRKSFRKVV